MNRIFGALVVAAMVGGVAAGWACHEYLNAAQAHAAADACGVVTDLFLRLVKMIIAPLVVTTLISGIAHMEDAAAVGRVGAKTLAWFLVGSILALAVGLIMVRMLQPGAGINLSHATAAANAAGLPADAFSLKAFLQHLVPSSVVDAMARNEILQIVVFSVFFGTAIAAMPGRAPVLVQAIEQAAAVMLKVTGYVMLFAPLAIFAALTATVADAGIGILWTYAQFIGGYYLALLVLWAVLALVGVAAAGPRGLGLLPAVREPVLLAFSTASSEAAYPSTLERLQAFGIPRRIVSFVLPLGYSFNLVGSMMYCTFAIMFIAQAYRIPLDLGQQITLLLILMVTSKGMAGVPRASLVVVAATIGYFHIPDAGLLLILAVDHLMDMGRSATNVVGNSIAAAVVARWEGALGPKAEPDSEAEAA
jgi:Na+/H+-dicarboxylate symporter